MADLTRMETTSFSQEDIRPARFDEEKERCIVKDRDFLLARKERWQTIACPACGEARWTLYGEKNGFRYVECSHCETVYTNPRPEEQLLGEFYASSQLYSFWNHFIFPASEETRRKKIFVPRAQKVHEYCRECGITNGTLLEIGAAFGIFCEEINKLDLFRRIIALEPTPDLAATCREKGFEVIENTIESLSEEDFADVVVAFEVIEHVFSPQKFLEICHRILRQDGLLILTCPNVKGFDLLTLRERSRSFDHEHLNYFHPRSLSLLLEKNGFGAIRTETPGQLDAGIVHERAVAGEIDLSEHHFLQEVLLRRWDQLGKSFQEFLRKNNLSSHMFIFARKSSR